MYIQLQLICLLSVKIITSLPQTASDDVRDFTQATHLSNEQIRQPRQGFGPTLLSFRPTTTSYDDDTDDHIPSSSHPSLSRASSYDDGNNYLVRNAIPVVQQRTPVAKTQSQGVRKSSPLPQIYRQQLEEETKQLSAEEKEKDIEEPDRLALLLPQSKFDCIGKNTGYYADDGLGCEVFHYCQNNAKHSWICPEGFTFHQIHLICMPPGQDNICEQSSQFHFINEFLYKPVNLEEHQSKPNVSLRYSDRFYPSQYNYQRDYNEEEEEEPTQHKQPIKGAVQQPQVQRGAPVHRRPIPTPFATTSRAENSIGQVFRSPEEVNISLQQRRPPYPAQRYIANEDY